MFRGFESPVNGRAVLGKDWRRRNSGERTIDTSPNRSARRYTDGRVRPIFLAISAGLIFPYMERSPSSSSPVQSRRLAIIVGRVSPSLCALEWIELIVLRRT